MNILLSQKAIGSLATAPPAVQRTLIKQLNFLARNLHHPSLHAKKFDDGSGRWQARVNDDWRFYFVIDEDTYRISDVIPHLK
jgi:plasmid maintenance system killer protein